VNQLIDGQSPARMLFMALAVIAAGLAAAASLATARHESTSPSERARQTLTEPTLATKPHGHPKPMPRAARFFATASR